MLGIEQKKGDPAVLCGRMLAYAHILPGDAIPSRRRSSPLDGMVHNGYLVVTGDFTRPQDFDPREDIARFLENLKESGAELPEGLDEETLREKMGEFSNMEIIPVPAKVVQFESEADILAQDADIYFLGDFAGQGQAHLCITSLPIYYQARYREQLNRILQSDIASLLAEVEQETAQGLFPYSGGDPAVLDLKGDLGLFEGHLLELLTGQVIPHLVYNTGNPIEFQIAMDRFKAFMKPYRYPADVQAIENILEAMRQGKPRSSDRRRLELLCRKVSALHHEEFEQLQAIQDELARLG